MVFGRKWVKILIVPLFWLKFDDVTVTWSLIVLSGIYFINLRWHYLTPFQNFSRFNVIFMVRKIGQLFKIFKILIVPSFWLTFDDITVTLSLAVLSGILFTNSPLYYLTAYLNLLRLNVIFMVRKIGQLLLDRGEWGRLQQRYCDVVFDCIVMNFFFAISSWYYLTRCQNLLELNVIFMVRKIGQVFKIFKILINPSAWLIFDDVTTALPYVVLSWISLQTHHCNIILYAKIF